MTGRAMLFVYGIPLLVQVLFVGLLMLGMGP
jgi:hypothetical protein